MKMLTMKNGEKGEEIPLIDWQDATFKTGYSTMSGISVSGGSEKTKYYLSGGFSDLNGIVPTSNVKNGDFRINLQSDLTKRLKVDTL